MEDPSLKQAQSALDDLWDLVKTLRSENGCPWDRKQTPQSISIYLLEEVFELVDAIASGNSEQIREELGDVLFHIVLIARMFDERGEFGLSEVARAITQKMIRRHPHVFGDKKVTSSAEVVQNWHDIKRQEQKDQTPQSLLDSVPANLPALMRAYRLTARVAQSGLECLELEGYQANLVTMAAKVQTAHHTPDNPLAFRQFGDLLFTLTNMARLVNIHPESALTAAVKKFETRFKRMEERVAASNRELEALAPAEMKRIWQQVGQNEP